MSKCPMQQSAFLIDSFSAYSNHQKISEAMMLKLVN